jgi:hypothetical protein
MSHTPGATVVTVASETVVTVASETVHTVGDSERNDTARRFASVEADTGTRRPAAVACGGSKRIVCGLVPVSAWNERRAGRAAA